MDSGPSKQPAATQSARRPTVSVIMAAYNAAATIESAITSVLRQTLKELELIVIDDGSSDDTLAVASRIALQDPRMRVFAHGTNRGPGAARNTAISKATGIWIAPVDADDFILPERFAELTSLGQKAGSDFIADNLLISTEADPVRPKQTAFRLTKAEPSLLDETEFVLSDIPHNGRWSLGFAKPLMSRSFLEHAGLRYSEELHVGEDFELYVRALMCGARFHMTPQALYVYHYAPSRPIERLENNLIHVQESIKYNRLLASFAEQTGREGSRRLLDQHYNHWYVLLWYRQLKRYLRHRQPLRALRALWLPFRFWMAFLRQLSSQASKRLSANARPDHAIR